MGDYSVLAVSAAPKFNSALSQMLLGLGQPHFVSSVSAARQALAQRHYDFVIINSPLPDDTGLRLSIDVSGGADTVALLLVRGENYEEVSARAAPQGVFTLAKPTPAQTLTQALTWMAAARERLRKLEKKTATIEEKMEEIRLVNRAKWLLIDNLKMTEADAHRYIEKQAMDRCVSKREIALGIIRTYA